MEWTTERVQLLKDMWGQGISASEIAGRLGGTSRNAVIGKAHRLGLSSRPSPIRRIPDSKAKSKIKVAPQPQPALQAVMASAIAPRFDTPRRENTGSSRSFLQDASVREGTAKTKSNAASSSASAISNPFKTGCQWPMGDPRKAGFHFCGGCTHSHLPYCLDHARIAYQSAARRKLGIPDEDKPVRLDPFDQDSALFNNY